MNSILSKVKVLILISLVLFSIIYCRDENKTETAEDNKTDTTTENQSEIPDVLINRFRILRRASIVGETTATIDKSSPIWEVVEETRFDGKLYKEADYKLNSKAKTITNMDITIYTEEGEDSISISRDNSTDEYNVTYIQNGETADNIFIDKPNTYIINTNLFQAYEFALQSIQYQFDDKNLVDDKYTFLSFIPSINEVFETQINKLYEEKLNINDNLVETWVFEVSRAGDKQKIWLDKKNYKLIKLVVEEGEIEVRRIIDKEQDLLSLHEPNLIKGERDFDAIVTEPLLEEEDTTDAIPSLDEEITEEDTDDLPYIETIETDETSELYSNSLDEDSYFDEFTKVYEMSISGVTFGYNKHTTINTETFYQVVEQTIMKLSKGPSVTEHKYNISYTWNKNGNKMLSYDASINYGSEDVLISLNERDDNHYLIRESNNERKELKLDSNDMKGTYFMIPYTVSDIEILLKNIDIESKKPIRINTVNPETNEKSRMVISSTELLKGGSVDTDFAQIKINSTIGGKDYIIYLNEDDNSIYKIDYPSENIVIRLSDKLSINPESLNSTHILSNLYVEDKGIDPGEVKLTDYPDFEYLAVIMRIEGKSPIGNPIDFYMDNRLQTFDGLTSQNEIKGTVEVQTINNTIYPSDDYPLKDIPDSVKPYTKATSMDQGIVNIPSEHPDIKAKAQDIAQGNITVFEVTNSIGEWVFNNIQYELLGEGALKTLETGKGDSGSMSQLTIAMLRSLGIPARVVGGLLYGNIYDNNFGQHYWVEVWIGEKGGWIMIDPTTGEIDKISPLHISLWRWENISPDEASYIDIAILERESDSD